MNKILAFKNHLENLVQNRTKGITRSEYLRATSYNLPKITKDQKNKV